MSDRMHRHTISAGTSRRRLSIFRSLAVIGLAIGATTSALAVSNARVRLNVQQFIQFAEGSPGSTVVVGNIGPGLVWPLHEAFGGRVVPLWLAANDMPVPVPSQQFLSPQSNGQLGMARGFFYTAHETAAASAIAGNWDPIPNVPQSATTRSVIGFAPDAKLILSAGFASGVTDNGFLIGDTAIAQTFALFAMVDPKIAGFAAAMLGIPPYPVATVVNASFGSVSSTKDRTGESILAHAFDAAVWRTDAVVVTAAGDDRQNPTLLNTINTDPLDPGGTAGSPGTAYNVLNVGRLNRAGATNSADENSSDGPVGVVDWRSAGITLLSTVKQNMLATGCTITASLPEQIASNRGPVDIAAPGTILTLAGSPIFDGRFFRPAATNQSVSADGPITLSPGDDTNKSVAAVGPYTLAGSFLDQAISVPSSFTLAGASLNQSFSAPGPFLLAGGASASVFTSAGASGGTLGMFSYGFTYRETPPDGSRASDIKITISDGVHTVSIGGFDAPGITPAYNAVDPGNPAANLDDNDGVYSDIIDLSTFMIDGATMTITITNDRAADANPNEVTSFGAILGGIFTSSGTPATLFDSGGASAGTLGMFTYSFTYNEPVSDASFASDMKITISDGTHTATIGGANFPGIAPSYNGSASDASGVYGDTIDLSAFGITVTASPPTNLTITISNDRGGDPSPNVVSGFTATLGGIFNSGGVATTIIDNTTSSSIAGPLGTFTYSFTYGEPVQDPSFASDIKITISDGVKTASIGGKDFPGSFVPAYNGAGSDAPGVYTDTIDLSAVGINGANLTITVTNDNGVDANPNVVSGFTATLGNVRDGILFTGGNGATGTLGVLTYSFTYDEPVLDASRASDMKITITDGFNTATIGGANTPGIAPSYQGVASDAPGVYGDSINLSASGIDGSTVIITISNDNGADTNPNVITGFTATLSGVNTVALNPDVNPTDPTAGVTRSFVPLWEGTSFASAIIAGAAALVQDIGNKNDIWLPEFVPQTDAQGSVLLDPRGNPIFVPKPQLDPSGNPVLDSGGNPLFVTKPSGLVTRAILINSVNQNGGLNVQQATIPSGPEQDACISANPLDRTLGAGTVDFTRLKRQLLANQVQDVRPNGLGGSDLITPFLYVVDGVFRTLDGVTRGSYNPSLDDPTDVIRRDVPPFDPANNDIQTDGLAPLQLSEDIPQVPPLLPIPGVIGGWFANWTGAGTGPATVGPTPTLGPVITRGTDPRKPFVTNVVRPVNGSGGPILASPEPRKPKTDVTVFPQGAHAFELGPASHKKSLYKPYGQPQILPPRDPDLNTDRFGFNSAGTGIVPGSAAGPGSGSRTGSGGNFRPSNTGWDHGKLGVGWIDYPIGIITPNSSVRATLVWNRTEIWDENVLNTWSSAFSIQSLQEDQLKPLMSIGSNDPASIFPAPNLTTSGRELPTVQTAFAFENLDLELYRVSLPNVLIGASRSVWGTVEHISVGQTPALCTPQNNSDILFGQYFLRVKYVDTMFDLGGYRYCSDFQTLAMINKSHVSGGVAAPGSAYKNIFPGEAEFAVAWFVDITNSPGFSFVQAIQNNPRDFNHDGVINNGDVAAMVASSLGDMDNDGVIGAADVSILLANFGSTDIAYDLNYDGVVNTGDLAQMLTRYGETPTP